PHARGARAYLAAARDPGVPRADARTVAAAGGDRPPAAGGAARRASAERPATTIRVPSLHVAHADPVTRHGAGGGTPDGVSGRLGLRKSFVALNLHLLPMGSMQS